jgi:signal transduction histidine kinase
VTEPRRDARPGGFLGLPRWLQLLAWAGIVAATVSTAPHHTGRRVATGIVMVIAALAMQFTGDGPRLRRALAITLASATGLAGMLLSPSGIAEIPVFMAATRIPLALSGRAMWTFVVVDALVTDAAIVWISGSFVGLLAGLGIPLLVQRSATQQQLVEEHDRAQALLAELQASRDAQEQAAALRERGRIAREMHDVLAHSLAGLSLQLQATRAIAVREGASAEVLEPLDTAAALARDGLAEARQAVGALRDPVGLGLDALPALVQRHPGEVELRVTGTPAEIAAEAGHALYRAVQESLTNSSRYAPGAPVRVTIAWTPDLLGVCVEDDGPLPGRVPVTGQGSGLGLAGMQERLSQHGGTLTAGPRPDGGWRVEATVPLS